MTNRRKVLPNSAGACRAALEGSRRGEFPPRERATSLGFCAIKVERPSRQLRHNASAMPHPPKHARVPRKPFCVFGQNGIEQLSCERGRIGDRGARIGQPRLVVQFGELLVVGPLPSFGGNEMAREAYLSCASFPFDVGRQLAAVDRAGDGVYEDVDKVFDAGRRPSAVALQAARAALASSA